MEFEKGKKVRVVRNSNSHGYKVPSIVTMDFRGGLSFGAEEHNNGYWWLIMYSDCEEIEEENVLSTDRIKEFVKPVEDYLNMIIEKAKIDLSNIESPVINDVPKFETIGIFTDSQSFFSDIIKNHDGETLKMFVMVREEKHLNGHKFDFMVIDSEFSEGKRLFDEYNKNK